MRSTSRIARSSPIVLVALLILLPAAAPASNPPDVGAPDPTVMDTMLAERLGMTPADELMDVIVRFDGPVASTDRDVLDDLGIETVGWFRIIPAAHIRATPRQVERLSGHAGVEWMEWDAPLDYLMDLTTKVINATSTWRSIVEGSLWGDAGIDGTGVTAVVLDTGIDAGHPDLDYGTKTIRNLKSDTGTGPWYEIENGDTSSGHGTHCAGTVAGNGDASAGQKAGVAPGANLIGLSTGEAGAITGAVGALQWTYENSRPGNNPYNIRVVSNSWGAGGGIYEPGDSISEAINKLVYENNVVCVFAAGNSYGDGNTIQSGNYANTPAAICVAASGRDGTYITEFSSKGRWDWTDTYPDVAAPGHYIESTAARRTQISAMTQQGDSNPYYLAISGTSMATPHVSGVVALLWQAAPSMRVSEVRQDAGVVTLGEDGTYTVIPVEELSSDDERYSEHYAQWNEQPDTLIHEAELIIKLTTDMIPHEGDGDPELNGQTGNWIPDWSVPGYAGERAHDWAQGYGLVNVRKAVGLALTLERIRWDHPQATVYDAWATYEGILEEKVVSAETDRVMAQWSGEWARFNEQDLNPLNLVFEANQTRYVYVPAGAEEVRVVLTWPMVNSLETVVGSLGFMIDYDDSGSWDYTSGTGIELDGARIETISASGNDGQYWRFGIEGHGLKWHRIRDQKQYEEARIEYEISVAITFGQGFGTIEIPPLGAGAVVADLKFAQPSQEFTMGNISMVRYVFNLNNVSYQQEVQPPDQTRTPGIPWWFWLLVFIIVVVLVALVVSEVWPDSYMGRQVKRVTRVTKVDLVIDKAKGATKGVVALVPGGGNKAPADAEAVDVKASEPMIVEAEVVSEEPDARETETPA